MVSDSVNFFKGVDAMHEDVSEITRVVQSILTAGRSVYARIDASQKLLEVEGDVTSVLGISDPSELIGQGLENILHGFKLEDVSTQSEISHDALLNMLRISSEAGDAKRRTLMLTAKDGRKVKVNCLFDEDGRCTLLLKDVTSDARKRRLFEISLEAANAGFWNMDLITGELTFSKSVTDRLTSEEIKHVEKRGLFSIMHPKDLTFIAAEWTVSYTHLTLPTTPYV